MLIQPMDVDIARVDAITFDFYDTLVYHKQGSGRGATLMEYLGSRGLECDPWEHQVLYHLFERHATDYSPKFDATEKRAYLEWLTTRLFARLNVRAQDGAAAEHVDEVWRLLGPDSLGVYPEVPIVLKTLHQVGFPLSVVSNWQCGLEHFCHELGIAAHVDHIIASAEVGVAKPNQRIFLAACARMGVSCERVLHVGDSLVDDVEGGTSVGMQVLLLQRGCPTQPSSTPSIRSLSQLLDMFHLDVSSAPVGDVTGKADAS